MADALDFRGKNLRGKSFGGRDLSRGDFSEADVRGADFSHAVLHDARFVEARLGITPGVGVALLITSMIVSVATGVAIGLFWREILERASSSDWRDVLAALLAGAVVVAFLGLLIGKGIRVAFRMYVLGFSAAVVVDMLITYTIAGELRLTQTFPLIVLFVLFVPAALAGVFARVTGGEFGAWSLIVVAAAGGWAAGRTSGGVAAIVVMGILVVVARRAFKEESRDHFLREIATRIVTRFGTRFVGADLSRADFRGANVNHANLTDAIMTGIVWDDPQ